MANGPESKELADEPADDHAEVGRPSAATPARRLLVRREQTFTDASRLRGEPRVYDPAHRDQDDDVWQPGRFGQRVRREWNQVPTADIRAFEQDVEALTDAIHARVGGDREAILRRLMLFQEVERFAATPPDRGTSGTGEQDREVDESVEARVQRLTE